MTGYELVSKLKKARRKHVLSATEQALYHELINICNETDWDEVFCCTNDELCGSLHISLNALIQARGRLVEAGLIGFRSGQSKRMPGAYTFAIGDAAAQPHAQTTPNHIPNNEPKTEPYPEPKTEPNPAHYNKLNRNAKPNQTSEDKSSGGEEKFFADGHSANGQGSLKKEKEKKSPAAKKEKEVTPHWRTLVNEWFHFYSTHAGSGSPPTFEGQAQASLKKICRRLRSRAEDAGYEWTEQMARDTLGNFLGRAWGISWLQSNFLLPNLERQYDKIVNQNDHEYKKHRNRHDDFSSIQSVFAAIDAMPGWT